MWPARAGSTLFPCTTLFRSFALYRIGERSDLRAALADLDRYERSYAGAADIGEARLLRTRVCGELAKTGDADRSEEHTSELQSQSKLVCRLQLENTI